MPENLLKIILRRFIETVQNHNNSIKAGYSGEYWQFQSEALRDALIEYGIKFDYNYRKWWNGANIDCLTASISILSDTTEYHNILTEIGFIVNNKTPIYQFKI